MDRNIVCVIEGGRFNNIHRVRFILERQNGDKRAISKLLNNLTNLHSKLPPTILITKVLKLYDQRSEKEEFTKRKAKKIRLCLRKSYLRSCCANINLSMPISCGVCFVLSIKNKRAGENYLKLVRSLEGTYNA